MPGDDNSYSTPSLEETCRDSKTVAVPQRQGTVHQSQIFVFGCHIRALPIASLDSLKGGEAIHTT